MIRVLLADDQEMVRTGFRLILSAEPGLEVVGEAGTGVDAVTRARELRPDVVLMDIRMPELDGLEATRVLVADPEPPRIVVVTTFDLDEYVYGALRAGACGFLLKDAGPRLLVEAVKAAAAGDALVSPSVTVRLLEHLAARPVTRTPATDRPAVTARAGRRPRRRPRPHERGDRRRAVRLALDGEDAPDEHPDEALGAQPRGDRRVGVGARPGALSSLTWGISDSW